jgi:hypothetical protein
MPVKNWAREQLDSWQLFLSQVYHLPSTRHQPVASSACFIQCCPVSSRTLHNQPVYVLHMQIVSPAADAETATWVPTEVPLDLGPDVQGFVALWKNQTTKASVYMRYQLRVHFRNFIESQVFGLLCPEVSKRYGRGDASYNMSDKVNNDLRIQLELLRLGDYDEVIARTVGYQNQQSIATAAKARTIPDAMKKMMEVLVICLFARLSSREPIVLLSFRRPRTTLRTSTRLLNMSSRVHHSAPCS